MLFLSLLRIHNLKEFCYIYSNCRNDIVFVNQVRAGDILYDEHWNASYVVGDHSSFFNLLNSVPYFDQILTFQVTQSF